MDDDGAERAMTHARSSTREASVGLERAREAIWKMLNDGDSDSGSAFDDSFLDDDDDGSVAVTARASVPLTPVGASIDARAKELEARGLALARRLELTSPSGTPDRAPTREGGLGTEALERAIAERDLEIYRRDEELRALRESVGALRSADEEREADASRAQMEDAERRAREAQAGARAMREALRDVETKHARERARLLDELRDVRAAASAYAMELKSLTSERARTNANSSFVDASTQRELEATRKRADVAEAFATNLERMLQEKSEELFETTQERDDLRRRLKATSDTIDSLEREWLEVSRQNASAQSALKEENEELHRVIDDLKSAEKRGFAEAEAENEALRARLHAQNSGSRSIDRNLARESIASLRSNVRELKEDIDRKDAELGELRGVIERKSIVEAINAEKDAVITALQAQINARAATENTQTVGKRIISDASSDAELDAFKELQTVAEALRRENDALRTEIEDIDADGVFAECLTLSRRVRAQDSLLTSYEERLIRYTEQLGIPFSPERRP
ncbi:unnamed product [Ostreococcus tauri]|uniref:Unnamed product n=1 Tax=Ostreococcus tauri TaxID=70448 RepID=A0A090MAC2_OSTTA|nr:unnamed product [Ostreococcus tauri]CEF99049.1 unnamed product [Ostreococcus tauri]|eukprot:XP_003081195.2 unnamed product [Ostreococcus tauri]